MMTLAIVAYPRIEDADRRWIDAVRAKHDPQASRIDVHFTLVFPVDVSPNAVLAEALAVARTTEPIAFDFRCAEAVREPIGGGGHVFLVPHEGRDAIISLHDRLYAGILRPHLRTDLPFVPHMTIAANPDIRRCEELAQTLNANGRPVRGMLSSIELVEVGAARVRSVMAFALRKPNAAP